MFKLKSDTELNFDSSREMQKAAYFDQNQYPAGYYHHSTPNGYGGYGHMEVPPEAHYRGNYHMQGTNSEPQASASGHYGPLDYSQHPYNNPQCNMPPNVSPTMGVPGQPMMPADPSMLKGHHPHGMGPQGAGHHPGSQLAMQGQEIYPWMKEHRIQHNKRTHQQTSPGEYHLITKNIQVQ